MENLNCFNMRTEQEINKWLKSRPWFSNFKRNLEEYSNRHGFKNAVRNCLTGKDGYNTISMAFMWEGTPEGRDYWVRRNVEFRQWFDNEAGKNERHASILLPVIFSTVAGMSVMAAVYEAMNKCWFTPVICMVIAAVFILASLMIQKENLWK